MKKRLGIINSSPLKTSYGGVGPFIKNLDTFLQKEFDVTYITLPDRLDNIQKIPRRFTFLLYLIFNTKKIKQQDIILSHVPEGSFVASYTKVPLIHIFHGNHNPMQGSKYWYGRYFKSIFNFFDERILKKARLVYTVGNIRPGVIKIFNPILHSVAAKQKRSGFIFAGRLETIKHIDKIIKVYALLPKDTKRIHKLYIAGNGTLENELKKLAATLGESNNVVFLGSLKNDTLIEEISSKKIALMASSMEGLPMIIAEAFSVALPVIATAVGDIARVLINDYNGFILPVDFDYNEYVNCIQLILLDYDKFSKNAFLSSDIFKAENVAKSLIKDIHSILKTCNAI